MHGRSFEVQAGAGRTTRATGEPAVVAAAPDPRNPADAGASAAVFWIRVIPCSSVAAVAVVFAVVVAADVRNLWIVSLLCPLSLLRTQHSALSTVVAVDRR